MINLFINYYIDKDFNRQQELTECLFLNMSNVGIDKIYILLETGVHFEVTHEKIAVFNIGHRPSFREYFKLINEVTSECDINIIANSDIYFDSVSLINGNIKENECYVLSRWDIKPDGTSVHFNRRDSYDCFIFSGQIKDIPDCDFTLGVPGCDDSIAERIERAGYVVKNPSIDIRTYHLHLSGIRNYKPHMITPRPYLLIHPHKIDEINILKQKIL